MGAVRLPKILVLTIDPLALPPEGGVEDERLAGLGARLVGRRVGPSSPQTLRQPSPLISYQGRHML